MEKEDKVYEYSYEFSEPIAKEPSREDIINSLLGEAKNGVLHQRQDNYGNPEDSFKMIAEMWSNYLNTEVSATDVANMMILLKICRCKNSPTYRDSWVDIIGYGICGAVTNKV